MFKFFFFWIFYSAYFLIKAFYSLFMNYCKSFISKLNHSVINKISASFFSCQLSAISIPRCHSFSLWHFLFLLLLCKRFSHFTNMSIMNFAKMNWKYVFCIFWSLISYIFSFPDFSCKRLYTLIIAKLFFDFAQATLCKSSAHISLYLLWLHQFPIFRHK